MGCAAVLVTCGDERLLEYAGNLAISLGRPVAQRLFIMKTISIENLDSVRGGAGISLGERSAWRSGMAQGAPPRIGAPHGPLPTHIPSNTSLGEMLAWRNGMSQSGRQKK